MKNINQIYSLVLESILNESIKDDAIKKFGDSEEVQTYVNKFWDKIRTKETDPDKKDINYWIKKGFPDFKEYIDNFKSNADIKRGARNLTTVDNGKGRLIKIIDGYELWKVNSYEAAKYLGRNYKNNPTVWCISSDNPKFWVDYTTGIPAEDIEDGFEPVDPSIFYFLISQTINSKDSPKHAFDKIALETNEAGYHTYWDLHDKKIPLNKFPQDIQTLILKAESDIEHVKDTFNQLNTLVIKDSSLDTISQFLKNNPNLIDDITKNQQTSLMTHVLTKQKIELALLLKHSLKIKYVDDIRPGIIEVLLNNNPENIKALVELGIGINRHTVLRAAFNAGPSKDIELVKYIIEHGLKIKDHSHDLLTWATYRKHNLDLVKYMIEKGANVTFIGQAPWAFFVLAIKEKRFDVTELALKNGFNVKDNWYILERLCNDKLLGITEDDALAVVKYYIEHGANINVSSKDSHEIIYKGWKRLSTFLDEYMATKPK